MSASVDHAIPTDIDTLRQRLAAIGQESVLQFIDELSEDGRRRLAHSINQIDLELVPEWVERYVKNKPTFTPPADLAPAP